MIRLCIAGIFIMNILQSTKFMDPILEDKTAMERTLTEKPPNNNESDRESDYTPINPCKVQLSFILIFLMS